jgi:hypothetical protein
MQVYNDRLVVNMMMSNKLDANPIAIIACGWVIAIYVVSRCQR